VAQYDAQSEKFKRIWDRVVSVISKLRSEKTSLLKAAKEQGVSPRTVKRLARSALQKRTNGKWTAKKSDRLLRVLMIPTSDGTREVGVRGSRQATLLGKYWNAVHKYLETGAIAPLARFKLHSIKDANGLKIPLITDPDELQRLGLSGVISFESLYARST
jgi:hypothetical protein